MTRAYAAKRLLEHGPLTFSEIVEITGWSSKAVECAIYPMVDQGIVVIEHLPGVHRRVYSLAA